jgi:hypothetical protein
MFDSEKLFLDVFHPEQGEHLVVVCDVPYDRAADNSLWRERRTMAIEWHRTLETVGSQVGFSVAPLITFPASGAHNWDLPLDDGQPVSLRVALDKAAIALALTELSLTATMVAWAKTHPVFVLQRFLVWLGGRRIRHFPWITVKSPDDVLFFGICSRKPRRPVSCFRPDMF